jgi:hypothetical protein
MDDVLAKFNQRSDKYRNVKGLLQKLYVRDAPTGMVGGIYFFDSKDNMEAFLSSDLAKSIEEAYKFVNPPTLTKLEVVNMLYENKKQVV